MDDVFRAAADPHTAPAGGAFPTAPGEQPLGGEVSGGRVAPGQGEGAASPRGKRWVVLGVAAAVVVAVVLAGVLVIARLMGDNDVAATNSFGVPEVSAYATQPRKAWTAALTDLVPDDWDTDVWRVETLGETDGTMIILVEGVDDSAALVGLDAASGSVRWEGPAASSGATMHCAMQPAGATVGCVTSPDEGPQASFVQVDAASGKEVERAELPVEDAGVVPLPDGFAVVAVAATDYRVELWSARFTGADMQWSTPVPAGLLEPPGSQWPAFTDGKYLYLEHVRTARMRVIDLADGALAWEENDAQQVALDTSGRMVLNTGGAYGNSQLDVVDVRTRTSTRLKLPGDWTSAWLDVSDNSLARLPEAWLVSDDHEVASISPSSGTANWRVTHPTWGTGVAFQYLDDRVFVTQTTKQISALNPTTGATMWSVDATWADWTDENNAVATDGTRLLVPAGSALLALDLATGAQAWTLPMTEEQRLVVCGDHLYLADVMGGTISRLDPS